MLKSKAFIFSISYQEQISNSLLHSVRITVFTELEIVVYGEENF